MIEEFRIEADDNAQPPMFADNEIRVWINQGYKEAARRSHCLRDSSTTAICSLTALAGTPEVAYSPLILNLVRVSVPAKQNKILRQIKAELLDQSRPNWESATGDAQCYVVGLNGRRLQLFPAPIVDTVLKMTVIRLPILDLENASDSPEEMFPEEYHQGLVQWALYKAFSKTDAEVNDTEKSNRALRAFEEEFGTREDANARLEQMSINQQTYQFNSGAY